MDLKKAVELYRKRSKKSKGSTGVKGEKGSKNAMLRHICMWAAIILICTAIFSFAYVAINNILMGNAKNISSLLSLDFFEKKAENADGTTDDDWGWNVGEETFPGGNDGNADVGTSGSGGTYPKDPKLKLRAQYIEICDKSAQSSGEQISGAWIMGVGTRESGGGQFRFSTANADMYKDLVMLDSFCGVGARCSWLKGGKSHIAGGAVSGGKDQGSPYTGRFTAEYYQTFGGDHAVGPFGFEILYLDNSNSYKFGEATRSQVSMDSSLNFNRPNPLYVPDAVQNNTMLHVAHMRGIPKNSRVLQSSEFKALSEKNKAIVMFSLAGSMYGVGSWQDWMNDWGIQLSKAGARVELDQLLTNSTYWSPQTLSCNLGSGHLQVINEMKAKTGMTWHAQNFQPGLPNKDTHFPWSGLQAINLGRIEREELMKLINSAEKEEGSGGVSGGEFTGGFVWPVNPAVSSIGCQFGARTYLNDAGKWVNDMHNGVDIVAGADTPIYSISDGIVTRVIKVSDPDNAGFYVGNCVKIRSTVNGADSIITYMHMLATPEMQAADGTVLKGTAMVGTKISKGTQIGLVGSTGNSTGAHLHFEVTGVPAVSPVTGYYSVPILPYVYGTDFEKTLQGMNVALNQSIWSGQKDRNYALTWNNKSLISWWYKGSSGKTPWGG